MVSLSWQKKRIGQQNIYLPKYLFIPFMLLVIVGGANAVNLTDGMDTLATVPLMTCTLFVGAVA